MSATREVLPAGTGVAGRLVSAQRLCVRRGAHLILDHVSIDVQRGEIVSLIGPNGAGKTTLLRALLGLLPIESGNIETMPGLAIGYMPQRITIDHVLPLTVRRFLGMAHGASKATIEAALGDVGIAQLSRRPVQEISGGEFQRVLLARALLHRPDLLVLDEPAQQVDFQGQMDMFELIDRLRRERDCGILVVSHDLHLVMGATDRVLCLNGHVCCSGKPETVSRHPEYIALFGPRAAESLAVYRHSHAHAHDLSGDVVPLEGADERER